MKMVLNLRILKLLNFTNAKKTTAWGGYAGMFGIYNWKLFNLAMFVIILLVDNGLCIN